jgi:hypothetical protein
MSRTAIPLRRRPWDAALVAFFVVNLFFTTYVVSLEQVVIDDIYRFTPPLWPPESLLALVHWWEKSFDPLLIARPAWYRATIWLDVLAFGPFYVAAIYAYAKGKEWIRIPSIIWGTMLFTNVFIILGDELRGIHATPSPAIVVGANAPWMLVPILVVARMWMQQHPFTEDAR